MPALTEQHHAPNLITNLHPKSYARALTVMLLRQDVLDCLAPKRDALTKKTLNLPGFSVACTTIFS